MHSYEKSVFNGSGESFLKTKDLLMNYFDPHLLNVVSVFFLKLSTSNYFRTKRSLEVESNDMHNDSASNILIKALFPIICYLFFMLLLALRS